ncbi:MAG: response regulator [Deltaproteobacteria bacterium]|nr:response regulator [Deltaproteobacteria bacterium]
MAEKRFSRFIVYVLILFQGVSLALIVGMLYGILSRSITSDFYNQIRAQGVEVSNALHDRITHLNTRLQELSLNNTVRVGLMLGVENPILEIMRKQYAYSDGAFYCLQAAASPILLPKLPDGLAPLKSHMERLSEEKATRLIRFEEPGSFRFLALLSSPIMRKEERLGTAFVCYRLSEDNRFWKQVPGAGRPRLFTQSQQELIDLRTGRAVPVSGNIQAGGNGKTNEVRTDVLPDHALVALADFPGVFYSNSSFPLEQQKRHLILILSALCAVIFLSTLLVAVLIARKVIHPLRSMADQAQEIASKPTGRFLNPKGIRHSEFRTLTRAFNQVLAGLFNAQKELKKSAEKELAASEERYRRTLEAAPDAITLTTLKEGRYLQVNEAFSKMTGFLVEEAVGRTVIELDMFVNPADRDTLLKELKVKGEVNGLEIRYRRKDRTLFDTLLSARRIRFGDEDCLLAVTSDITALKEAQREKARLEKKLQQSQKMEAIGALAGGVAHDLNNILSGLVSYPELLLMDLPRDSPMKRPLLTIQRSGEKAAAIVQDLLTLARRGVAITEVVNLNNIVSEYMMSPEYEKLKSYHSTAEVAADLEPGLLNTHGSPIHLSKTVMNLVSNALEAMPGGGKVTVTTRNLYIDRPIKGYEDVNEGDYILLTITDTGTGISSEDLERIFEPFYTKKHMGRSGTGLGLSVVWGTVKDHNGYIDVESIEGRGTQFKLYFPATRETSAGEKEMVPSAIYAGGGESILVVDDVEEQREIAGIMLRKLGYDVASVSSGEEAIAYMKARSADLLLLDMIMDPGMDGLDAYMEILKMHPGQKAVIASGFSETGRVKAAKDLGAGVYIKKPYIMEKLGLAVKQALEKQEP